MNARKPRKTFRQTPAWQIALADVLALGICLLVFAYFDHVKPSVYTKDTSNQNISLGESGQQANSQQTGSQQTDIQQADAQQQTAVPAAEPTKNPADDWKVKFADQFVTGEPVRTATSYKSENVSVTLTMYSVPEDEVTYYVQDVYVANIECIRNVFADDTFGKGITEEVVSMDNRVGAIGAINGDYYGHGSVGVVIRNGVLYRESWAPDQDVMVLFRDGTMKAYATEKEFNAQEVMAAGAWQAWCFGPSLLDANGELLESYERTKHDPRTVFGMIEPGHYVLITIDGRQPGYSEGTTYSETAKLCKALGCTVAYNLDGGKTSQMTFNGHIVNSPYEGGRKLSDLIYVADIG